MCAKQNRRFKPDVFNMIAGINKSKTLTKHVACECICKFDGWKCNPNQKWANNKCRCVCKNLEKHHACEKDWFWNSANVLVKMVDMYYYRFSDYVLLSYKRNKNRYNEKYLDNNYSNKKHFNKNYFNKKYFNRFLYFTVIFINYHSIVNRC